MQIARGSNDNQPRPESKGIPKYKEKLAILQQITESASREDLLMKLAKTDSARKSGESPNLVKESFEQGKWNGDSKNSSDPKKGPKGRLFLNSIKELVVTKKLVPESKISDFMEDFRLSHNMDEILSYFPKAILDKVGIKKVLETQYDRDQFKIFVDYSSVFASIEQGVVNDNKVDQLLCYVESGAAKTWDDVVSSRQYKQYEYCTEALAKLLESDLWRNFCVEKVPDGCICLGGGSASKDIQILNSLSRFTPLKELTYTLVDYSVYMLVDTCKKVREGIVDFNADNKITINPLQKNFLKLRPWIELRRPEVPVAWFINGGTLGNLNEHSFFDSVSKRAEVGDWLSISIETLPESLTLEEHYEENKGKLEEQYNQQYIRNLVKPALHAAWPFLEREDNLSNASRDIKYSLSKGLTGGHTILPDSLSVEISTNNNLGKKVTLLASTRYTESSFIKFAEGYGFKYQTSFVSDNNENYKILTFKFFPH